MINRRKLAKIIVDGEIPEEKLIAVAEQLGIPITDASYKFRDPAEERMTERFNLLLDQISDEKFQEFYDVLSIFVK